jgi:hypothetical protein
MCRAVVMKDASRASSVAVGVGVKSKVVQVHDTKAYGGVGV